MGSMSSVRLAALIADSAIQSIFMQDRFTGQQRQLLSVLPILVSMPNTHRSSQLVHPSKHVFFCTAAASHRHGPLLWIAGLSVSEKGKIKRKRRGKTVA